ncbi:hypothetical protein ACWDSF_30785 [Nocardia beijingensis]|uniref:hypothetical protein n=1 Tax=Nocardia beijingensis TaxID=95162 RepID=UPI0033EB0BB6
MGVGELIRELRKARGWSQGRLSDELAAHSGTNISLATHLEMHRGLMLVRAGDRAEGVRAARNAMEALPSEKHSLTLRMLMDEIAGSGDSAA